MVSRNTLVMIAKLYYAGNLSQQEIADMMGFTRLKVSRLLKECRDKHIVEFTFNANPLLRDDMAAAIKTQLNLKDVLVVTTESNTEKSKSAVGKAAAAYFSQKIQDNMSVGIAWAPPPTNWYSISTRSPSARVAALYSLRAACIYRASISTGAISCARSQASSTHPGICCRRRWWCRTS